MDKASEAILSLKPVTFRYKQEISPMASRIFHRSTSSPLTYIDTAPTSAKPSFSYIEWFVRDDCRTPKR